MGVISLRLKEKESKRIDELSEVENKDRSAVTRELIDYGWTYLMIKRYKEGKLSLGILAKKLEVSIIEAIELLSEQGIESNISYEDYLKGFDSFTEYQK